MEHTHINRNNTNAKILATASAIAYPPNGHAPHRQIMKFSEFHEKRRSNLLGHLIRCENEDPLRQITFQNVSARRNIIGKKSGQTETKLDTPSQKTRVEQYP